MLRLGRTTIAESIRGTGQVNLRLFAAVGESGRLGEVRFTGAI